MASLLWRSCLSVKKSIRPIKNWVMRRCLRGSSCSKVHYNPVVYCFIKIQTDLTFLLPTYPAGFPGKEAVKRVSVSNGLYSLDYYVHWSFRFSNHTATLATLCELCLAVVLHQTLKPFQPPSSVLSPSTDRCTWQSSQASSTTQLSQTTTKRMWTTLRSHHWRRLPVSNVYMQLHAEKWAQWI